MNNLVSQKKTCQMETYPPLTALHKTFVMALHGKGPKTKKYIQ